MPELYQKCILSQKVILRFSSLKKIVSIKFKIQLFKQKQTHPPHCSLILTFGIPVAGAGRGLMLLVGEGLGGRLRAHDVDCGGRAKANQTQTNQHHAHLRGKH